MWQYNNANELYHYGVLGMRWGHRKARPVNIARDNYRMAKAQAKARAKADIAKAKQEYMNSQEYKVRQAKRAKIMKAVKIGTAVAGTALAAYGTYKLSKAIKSKAYNRSYEQGKAIADSIFKSNYVSNIRVNNGTYDFKNTHGKTVSSGKYVGDSGYRSTLDYLDKRNRNVLNTYYNDMKNARKNAEYNSRNLINSIKYLRKGN